MPVEMFCSRCDNKVEVTMRQDHLTPEEKKRVVTTENVLCDECEKKQSINE